MVFKKSVGQRLDGYRNRTIRIFLISSKTRFKVLSELRTGRVNVPAQLETGQGDGQHSQQPKPHFLISDDI